MELFPKGMVLEAGKGGGGGGGVWREGGEEERGREGGGLCLEETLRAPVPRPFKNPSARPLPFQALSSVLSVTFASAALWQGARSGPRSREKTETTHNVSVVSFKRVVLTVIIVMCGFSLCPLKPEK